jgi:uncharacterized protein (TIGR02391 family)
MEATRNPEYLRSVAGAVRQFREAFDRFMALHIFNEGLARGIAPAVFPRDDAKTSDIERVTSEVAQAAGRAGAATRLTHAYIEVAGVGTVDPIAAWHSITRPKPVLEPPDITTACDMAVGRLDALIAKAEAEAPPTVGVATMHPVVWGGAKRLWRDGHYREAVASAAEALVAQVKIMTGRNDVAETDLWRQVFSSDAATLERPRLRWPGQLDDRNVKSMQDGLRQFAPGVQMTIRNPATHLRRDMTEQEALERLATLSLLARWVDECQLDTGGT